jgi:hypothetical protein
VKKPISKFAFQVHNLRRYAVVCLGTMLSSQLCPRNPLLVAVHHGELIPTLIGCLEVGWYFSRRYVAVQTPNKIDDTQHVTNLTPDTTLFCSPHTLIDDTQHVTNLYTRE